MYVNYTLHFCFAQSSAKEALRKVYQERNEAVQKLSAIERALCSSEDECSLLRDQLLKTQQNFQEVTSMLSLMEDKNFEMTVQIQKNELHEQQHETEMRDLREQLQTKTLKYMELFIEQGNLKDRIEMYEQFDKLNEPQPGDQQASDESDNNINNKNQIAESDEQNLNNADENCQKSRRNIVMSWLENSKISELQGSEDIMKAICKVS